MTRNANSSRQIEIGCQGWNYADWISGPASDARVFYPHGTRAPEMLEIYARAFSTVEVDSTFYAVPSAATVAGWAKRAPKGFSFSLKLPQAITHEQALRGAACARLLEEFCERARLLGEKLAVTLVQLPPQFIPTPENVSALREFLPQLPRDLRFSIEFRAGEWLIAEVAEWLERFNVALALVAGEWIGRERMRWAAERAVTADFAYLRWMGARDLTRFDRLARPLDEDLRQWREIIAALPRRVTKVYAYFSNFYEGHAPASANKLKRLLGQPIVEAASLEDQPSLF